MRAAQARPAYGTFQTGQQPVRSLRDDGLAVPGRQDAPADGADRHHTDHSVVNPDQAEMSG
ncbi:hypothetical protein E4K10_01470 [Streptomyces sp. T1317-0309]|nr:hypothetical protein E4K10_01470 [Streptomyces sp. T1317-0309]